MSLSTARPDQGINNKVIDPLHRHTDTSLNPMKETETTAIPYIPPAPRRPVGAPPELMTKEDSMRMNEVRKELWTGGFKGMASGLLAGYLGSICGKLQVQKRMHLWNIILSSKNGLIQGDCSQSGRGESTRRRKNSAIQTFYGCDLK